MVTYYIQSHHCHQCILESHHNDQKIECIVHYCTGMLHFDRKLYKYNNPVYTLQKYIVLNKGK